LLVASGALRQGEVEDSRLPRFFIIRVEEQRHAAADLTECRQVAGDDRNPRSQRFDHGQSISLGVARKEQRSRRREMCKKLLVGTTVEFNDMSAKILVLIESPKHVVGFPSPLTDDEQPRRSRAQFCRQA
jgi:hypothetical protein